MDPHPHRSPRRRSQAERQLLAIKKFGIPIANAQGQMTANTTRKRDTDLGGRKAQTSIECAIHDLLRMTSSSSTHTKFTVPNNISFGDSIRMCEIHVAGFDYWLDNEERSVTKTAKEQRRHLKHLVHGRTHNIGVGAVGDDIDVLEDMVYMALAPDLRSAPSLFGSLRNGMSFQRRPRDSAAHDVDEADDDVMLAKLKQAKPRSEAAPLSLKQAPPAMKRSMKAYQNVISAINKTVTDIKPSSDTIRQPLEGVIKVSPKRLAVDTKDDATSKRERHFDEYTPRIEHMTSLFDDISPARVSKRMEMTTPLDTFRHDHMPDSSMPLAPVSVASAMHSVASQMAVAVPDGVLVMERPSMSQPFLLSQSGRPGSIEPFLAEEVSLADAIEADSDISSDVHIEEAPENVPEPSLIADVSQSAQPLQPLVEPVVKPVARRNPFKVTTLENEGDVEVSLSAIPASARPFDNSSEYLESDAMVSNDPMTNRVMTRIAPRQQFNGRLTEIVQHAQSLLMDAVDRQVSNVLKPGDARHTSFMVRVFRSICALYFLDTDIPVVPMDGDLEHSMDNLAKKHVSSMVEMLMKETY